MKTIFFAFADKRLASSRLRAWWITEGIGADCQLWQGHPEGFLDYDIIIFQKQWPQSSGLYGDVPKAMAYFKEHGKRVIWDLTDPVWCWIPRDEFAKMEQAAEIVVSTHGLADDLAKMGVRSTVIIDRLPYREGEKVHTETDCPVLLWYGHAANRLPNLIGMPLLWQRLHLADKMRFTVRILDEKPEEPEKFGFLSNLGVFEYRRYEWEREHEELLQADIALLPPYPGPSGEMKGSIKWAGAAWAGLPVFNTQHYYYLRDLLGSAELRALRGGQNRQIAERDHDIRASFAEWRTLLDGDRGTCEPPRHAVGCSIRHALLSPVACGS